MGEEYKLEVLGDHGKIILNIGKENERTVYFIMQCKMTKEAPHDEIMKLQGAIGSRQNTIGIYVYGGKINEEKTEPLIKTSESIENDNMRRKLRKRKRPTQKMAETDSESQESEIKYDNKRRESSNYIFKNSSEEETSEEEIIFTKSKLKEVLEKLEDRLKKNTRRNTQKSNRKRRKNNHKLLKNKGPDNNKRRIKEYKKAN
ncbi:6592_t:CDS:2 [Diversispora eburnea]|uniref:6592_t:CDS:1 n=1 Tax=Diversispora eburnea TaxID=1213867 RepID=A0A9N9CEU3_9GLOM|nr:6592_t:CDS:2 [Diversispora eburnea]